MTDRTTEMLALADRLDFAAGNTNGCLYSQRKMLTDAAKAIRTAATSQASVNAMREALERVMAQTESDLASAHAEICKLQNLDPAQHSWPEWSPQANTLRWFKVLRNEYLSTPAPAQQAVDAEAEAVWPHGCTDPDACSRHNQCMYVPCRNQGRNIESEIASALINGGRDA